LSVVNQGGLRLKLAPISEVLLVVLGNEVLLVARRKQVGVAEVDIQVALVQFVGCPAQNGSTRRSRRLIAVAFVFDLRLEPRMLLLLVEGSLAATR